MLVEWTSKMFSHVVFICVCEDEKTFNSPIGTRVKGAKIAKGRCQHFPHAHPRYASNGIIACIIKLSAYLVDIFHTYAHSITVFWSWLVPSLVRHHLSLIENYFSYFSSFSYIWTSIQTGLAGLAKLVLITFTAKKPSTITHFSVANKKTQKTFFV